MAYVPPERQLVIEITVSDLARSIQFYQALDFELVRAESHFAALQWENSSLLLEERPTTGKPEIPAGNVRVMVPNVDDYWKRCLELECEVFADVADRYYGLRDFTILDPDGFGIRFATPTPT